MISNRSTLKLRHNFDRDYPMSFAIENVGDRQFLTEEANNCIIVRLFLYF